MLIKEYLEERGMSTAEFSRRVGITPQTMYNFMRGKCEPRLSTAMRIVELGEGKIKYEDLIPPVPPNIQE